MPDPQDPTLAQGSQIVQNPILPAQPPAPMGNNGGFFKTLLGTLLNGAMVGNTVQPGPGAIQRGAATAQASPLVNKQLAQKQQEQEQSARTMQQMQMAQTQLNLLHTYHMMVKEGQDQQDEAYDTARDYYKGKDDQGKLEWIGGATPDRNVAIQQAETLRKQSNDPESSLSIQVVPMPSSSHGEKMWGVARTLRGPLDDDVSVTMKGDPASGLPDKTVTVTKGMDSHAADALFSNQFKNHLISKNVAQNTTPAPSNPTGVTSQQDLVQEFRQRGIQVPGNMDDIWSVYSGDGSAKDLLPAKAGGPNELNKEQSYAFIHKWIDPNFNPELADRNADYNKTLGTDENNYAKEGGKDADQAIADSNRVLMDDKAPTVLKKRAQSLLSAAQPISDKYHQEQVQKNAKSGDELIEKTRNTALAPITKVTQADEGKVTDLQGAMDALNQNGGEGDAIAAISALRGLVGGGGVRITSGELQSIAKQRGWTGSFDVFSNNLTNPDEYASLSETQRTQLKQILQDAYGKIKERDDAYRDTADSILNAGSVQDIRKAQSNLNNRLRIPVIGVLYKFKDGNTRRIDPSKVDRAKALGAVPSDNQ